MSPGAVIGSAAVALGTGIVIGIGFRFFTGDSRVRYKRDMVLGVLGAMIGWLFGMAIPIHEHKLFGAESLAGIVCLWALFVYWVVFKEKTNLAKNFDADSPRHRIQIHD